MRSWWFGLCLITCASLVYYLSYHLHFIDMIDEGLLVNGALRLLDGQKPVTEFWAYPPGRYALLAAAFKFLGIHLTSERYLLVTLLVLRNVFVFLVARRLLPTKAAIVISLTLMLVPGPWHKVFYSLPVFAHLLMLLYYIDKPTALRAAFCGVLSGLAFYLRQDIVVFCLLASGFVIAAVRVTGIDMPDTSKCAVGLKSCLRSMRHLAIVLVCAVMVLAPFFLYYAQTSDFQLLLNRLGPDPALAVDVVNQRSRLMPIRLLPRMVSGASGGWMNYRFLNAWFPWVLYLGLGLAVAIGLHTVWAWCRSQRVDARHAVRYAALLAWSALAMSRVINLPNTQQLLIAGQGMIIVITALLLTAWAWARRGKQELQYPEGLVLPDWPVSLRWLLTVTFATVVMISWFWLLLLAWVPVSRVSTGSLSCRFLADTSLSLSRAELTLPQSQAESLHDVVTQVQKRTDTGEPMFAYHQAMLYFLADRPNPTGFDNVVPPIVLPEVAQEMTGQIAQTNPPAIQVVDLSASWIARMVTQYPDDLRSALFMDYQATDRFGDYQLLEPSPGSDAREQIDPLWLRLDRPARKHRRPVRKPDFTQDE